jgi:tetratricopeptide (TPR) repeat protein
MFHDKSGLLVGCLLLFIGLGGSLCQAEPFRPFHLRGEITGNGKYVIGIFSSYITIWDTDQLWDGLHPAQIHVLRPPEKYSGDISYFGKVPVSVSENGRWFGYEDHKKIRVCAMDKHFPLRFSIPMDDKPNALALSPNGGQLIISTANHLLLVELPGEGPAHIIRKRDREGSIILKADWARGNIAIREKNGIVLRSSKDLEEKVRVPHVPEGLDDVAFTKDGKHLLAAWKIWNRDLGVYKHEVKIFGIGTEAARPKNGKTISGAKGFIRGDSAEDLWYVMENLHKKCQLVPIGPAGEKLNNRRITFDITEADEVIGLSRTRGYAVIRKGDSYLIFDLASQWPVFELYSSKVKYSSTRDDIPHLAPRLGVDPMYEELERMSLDFDWSAYSGSWDRAERLDILMWLAAMVTRLRDRYDRVWFALLTALRNEKKTGKTYDSLSMLCAQLTQLNNAQYWLISRNAESAIESSRQALQDLRARKKKDDRLPEIDIHSPDLGILISHYWNTMERDSWLAMGYGYEQLGRNQDAEVAYVEVLRCEPRDWRAYKALLRINLAADDATFYPLVQQAQSVLRFKGWTDKLPCGYPDKFFDEKALARMHRVARQGADRADGTE